MAISNFIPTIWSENLYNQLDGQYIAVRHCNRDYEGEIKRQGSVVSIVGVGAVNVFDYTKNTDMTAPQTLSDNVRNLTIDQAKAFNFQIDDIDRAQSMPKLMNSAMRVAASALAKAADTYVCSLFSGADNSITSDDTTTENVIDYLLSARTKLFKNNVTNADDIVIEVSPEIAELILKAKLQLTTDTSEVLEHGCIGSIGGCRIYVTNNIKISRGPSTGDGSGLTYYKCVARTKRAIAFAEQLSEINAYRPEKRFADAVKGLHLYGAKVVYPSEMVLLDLGINT